MLQNEPKSVSVLQVQKYELGSQSWKLPVRWCSYVDITAVQLCLYNCRFIAYILVTEFEVCSFIACYNELCTRNTT